MESTCNSFLLIIFIYVVFKIKRFYSKKKDINRRRLILCFNWNKLLFRFSIPLTRNVLYTWHSYNVKVYIAHEISNRIFCSFQTSVK